MKRRDLQLGLIKALGGGFDAADTNLAIDGQTSKSAPSQTASAASKTAN
jgi:hypothetical protein